MLAITKIVYAAFCIIYIASDILEYLYRLLNNIPSETFLGLNNYESFIILLSRWFCMFLSILPIAFNRLDYLENIGLLMYVFMVLICTATGNNGLTIRGSFLFNAMFLEILSVMAILILYKNIKEIIRN